MRVLAPSGGRGGEARPWSVTAMDVSDDHDHAPPGETMVMPLVTDMDMPALSELGEDWLPPALGMMTSAASGDGGPATGAEAEAETEAETVRMPAEGDDSIPALEESAPAAMVTEGLPADTPPVETVRMPEDQGDPIPALGVSAPVDMVTEGVSDDTPPVETVRMPAGGMDEGEESAPPVVDDGAAMAVEGDGGNEAPAERDQGGEEEAPIMEEGRGGEGSVPPVRGGEEAPMEEDKEEGAEEEEKTREEEGLPMEAAAADEGEAPGGAEGGQATLVEEDDVVMTLQEADEGAEGDGGDKAVDPQAEQQVRGWRTRAS
jgi:hypothetical protein